MSETKRPSKTTKKSSSSKKKTTKKPKLQTQSQRQIININPQGNVKRIRAPTATSGMSYSPNRPYANTVSVISQPTIAPPINSYDIASLTNRQLALEQSMKGFLQLKNEAEVAQNQMNLLRNVDVQTSARPASTQSMVDIGEGFSSGSSSPPPSPHDISMSAEQFFTSQNPEIVPHVSSQSSHVSHSPMHETSSPRSHLSESVASIKQPSEQQQPQQTSTSISNAPSSRSSRVSNGSSGSHHSSVGRSSHSSHVSSVVANDTSNVVLHPSRNSGATGSASLSPLHSGYSRERSSLSRRAVSSSAVGRSSHTGSSSLVGRGETRSSNHQSLASGDRMSRNTASTPNTNNVAHSYYGNTTTTTTTRTSHHSSYPAPNPNARHSFSSSMRSSVGSVGQQPSHPLESGASSAVYGPRRRQHQD